MDIAIMIEGQNGLNWPRWKKIAKLVEDLGFAGLYRSDHFTNTSPPDIDSLDLWISFTWLAENTRRIEFGPLVTPFSFRHPVHTARMGCAVVKRLLGCALRCSPSPAGAKVRVRCALWQPGGPNSGGAQGEPLHLLRPLVPTVAMLVNDVRDLVTEHIGQLSFILQRR